MPRATNSPASRARRKRVLHRAKGFRGFRSKLFRYAKDAVRKAMDEGRYHVDPQRVADKMLRFEVDLLAAIPAHK